MDEKITCIYEVWDPALKHLMPCGAPATVNEEGHALCREHGGKSVGSCGQQLELEGLCV
jgi:hypothetical protein